MIKKRKLAINRSLKLKPTAKFSIYGVISLMIFLVLFVTIGYSAMATELNISGEVNFRTEADIRIVDNQIAGITNGGSIVYNPNFSRETVITGVNLPHLNSTVSFEVTVTNFTNIPMRLEAINNLNMSNPNMTYTLTGIATDDVVDGFETKTFTITFHYRDTVTTLPANRNLESRIEFVFVAAVTNVTVTFNANGATSIGATSLTCSYTFPATSCSLTAPTITREGWSVLGWNQDASATTSTWDVGASRSVSANQTWHAITVQATVIDVEDFPFTGNIRSVTLVPGTYHLQVWGAQGGSRSTVQGGMGGFSEGIVTFTTPTTVFIGTGGQPALLPAGNGTQGAAGFNGGGQGGRGNAASPGGNGGGGASHISLSNGVLSNSAAHSNVLLVAGGGGGVSGASQSTAGGPGGGIIGIVGGVGFGTGGGPGQGGTQTAGGAGGIIGTAGCTNGIYLAGNPGTAGQGGGPVEPHGAAGPNSGAGNGGGGGGWFGGGSAGNCAPGSGGGGSGHLSARIENGHGITARTIPGNQSMPDPNGGNRTGRPGNGFVRISLLEKYIPIQEFEFTGTTQTATLTPGTYRLEAWGAQGGKTHGGRGGYARGDLTITTTTTFTIMVGGRGAGPASAAPGGFNGGGRGGNHSNTTGGGGGASDIRAVGATPNHRILVAGGGGGAGSNHGNNSANDAGGAGGGLSGIDGISGTGASGPTWSGFGATQTAGGGRGSSAGPLTQVGSFGVGGSNMDSRTGGGGGGGWFGGGAAPWGGAGGGSGYALTNTSHRPTGFAWPAGNNTFSMTNILLTAGNASMPNPAGGTMTGNLGNGFIRITRL